MEEIKIEKLIESLRICASTKGGATLDNMEVFSRRLQTLREKRGIKRAVASELCGFSPNAFRRYERGEMEPSARALQIMAEEFGVSMDYLWGISEK